MAIRVEYRGELLEFPHVPRPDEIRSAYAARRHTSAAPAPAVSDPQPVSCAQEWQWLLHDLLPRSAAYHLPRAVRLRGPVDVACFLASIGDVAARQESLRTTFALVGDRPKAFVHASAAVSAVVVDLSACSGERRAPVARLLMKQFVTRPFDFAAAPPWRACMVQCADDDHITAFVLHHIIADGWSLDVLFNEIAAAYRARSARRPLALPPLPVQYSAFARRQRAALEDAHPALLEYWRRQLAGAAPVLTVSRLPRPASRSSRGGRYTFRASEDVTRRLRDLGRAHGATLFMALLATFELLLFRLTAEEDFCVGMPVAGRLEQEVEPLIGCFINTLPIRANVRGNPTFVELMERVRRTVLEALAHQALPFGLLVQELRTARSTSYTPIFQVVFDFNGSAPGRPPHLPGLSLEPVGTPLGTAKTDLVVDLWRGADGLLGAVEYDRSLFDGDDVARIVDGFQTLLEGVSADPFGRLASFSIESDAARDRRTAVEQERDGVHRQRLAAIRRSRRGQAPPVSPDAQPRTAPEQQKTAIE